TTSVAAAQSIVLLQPSWSWSSTVNREARGAAPRRRLRYHPPYERSPPDCPRWSDAARDLRRRHHHARRRSHLQSTQPNPPPDPPRAGRGGRAPPPSPRARNSGGGVGPPRVVIPAPPRSPEGTPSNSRAAACAEGSRASRDRIP